MAPAVARQEHRLRVPYPPEAQRVGRIAPRGRDPLLPEVGQPGKIVDARAPDDPDNCFGHSRPAPVASGSSNESR